MANEMDFLNGYRTLANCEFDDSERGQVAKQIIDEMQFSSIMNTEASVMEANGDFEHKAYRDNELDDGAEFLAFDEGFAKSGFTYDEECSVRMGRIAEAKAYRKNQTRYDSNAEALKRARDLQKAADAMNRKDARSLVYGGTNSVVGKGYDSKAYNGLASFTNSLYDLRDVYKAIDEDRIPFTGKDSCITIDAREYGPSGAVDPVDGKAGSIFAIVWGPDYVTKLYPKADTVSYGISMEFHPQEKFEYKDRVSGADRFGYEDVYTFEKFTGLWVGNRWGLIRIANINMDSAQTDEQWKAQLERVEESAGNAMRLFDVAGVTARTSWYTNGALVQRFKQIRAAKQVYVAGVSAQGQPQNIEMQIPFMLLDSVQLKNELTMSQFEKIV